MGRLLKIYRATFLSFEIQGKLFEGLNPFEGFSLRVPAILLNVI